MEHTGGSYDREQGREDSPKPVRGDLGHRHRHGTVHHGGGLWRSQGRVQRSGGQYGIQREHGRRSGVLGSTPYVRGR